MKRMVIVAAALVTAIAMPGMANAKGCLKGAAVGGVGGHLLGGHGVAGAAAGCAVGTYRANKMHRQTAARRTTNRSVATSR